MFKEMRKKSREVFGDEINEILNTGEYGSLATICENGYPYSVPVNYVYFEDAIYFHCATTGQKLDNINLNPKVSFSVVSKTEIIQEKYTTNYDSVILFGNATKIDGDEKFNALLNLVKKYSPDFIDGAPNYIRKYLSATTIIKIKIDHITGKSSI